MKANAQEARWNGRTKTPNADTDAMDEISLGFDDDLLRPRSPVSPIAEGTNKNHDQRRYVFILIVIVTNTIADFNKALATGDLRLP